jgi:hypothetical protein
MRRVDVLLEERAVWRVPIDVALLDLYVMLLQKTSGVAAGRSRGLPEECGLRHTGIVLIGRVGARLT